MQLAPNTNQPRIELTLLKAQVPRSTLDSHMPYILFGALGTAFFGNPPETSDSGFQNHHSGMVQTKKMK
jgi:hypothetical protein